MLTHYTGKTVLVTGAGGSIGSAICRELLAQGIAELRLLSLTENGLYEIMRELKPRAGNTKLVPLLGSVRNWELVQAATLGAQIVIHAAAHKHVPICEDNPCEAILNNVFGTETLAAAAGRRGAESFVLISTDKAVNPTSVMGATKRLAELIVHRTAKNNPATKFRVVRFGNVYGSAGSVIPLWEEQLKRGEPLTITDPEATRYFMDVSDAVNLVLQVPQLANTEVGPYVFYMGAPVSIGELAQRFLHGRSAWSHPIKEIGMRPGEKLHEELYYAGPRIRTAQDKINLIHEKTRAPAIHDLYLLFNAADSRHEVNARAQLMGLAKESESV